MTASSGVWLVVVVVVDVVVVVVVVVIVVVVERRALVLLGRPKTVSSSDTRRSHSPGLGTRPNPLTAGNGSRYWHGVRSRTPYPHPGYPFR